MIPADSQLVQVFENNHIRIGFPHFLSSVKNFVELLYLLQVLQEI